MYEPENENGISEQPEEKDGEYRYDGGFEKESFTPTRTILPRAKTPSRPATTRRPSPKRR